jgi:hypothetical protein
MFGIFCRFFNENITFFIFLANFFLGEGGAGAPPPEAGPDYYNYASYIAIDIHVINHINHFNLFLETKVEMKPKFP